MRWEKSWASLTLWRWAPLALMVFMTPQPLLAHNVPFSYLDIHVGANGLSATCTVHAADLARDLAVTPEELLFAARQHFSNITALLAPRISVRGDGQTLSPIWTDISVDATSQTLALLVEYPMQTQPAWFEVRAVLVPRDPNHQTYLNVYDGTNTAQVVLTASHSSFEYFVGSRQGTLALLDQFLPEGIRHILTGPDHVLFLIGLLLLGGGIRKVMIMVSMFTLAHSVTLSLAALNVLNLPPFVVEPAIAASIVCVGFENLQVSRGQDHRALIAFVFGFIHGFGFANVLQQMALPCKQLLWSLLSFNGGVEVGQLLIVASIALVMFLARMRNDQFGRRLAWAGSLLVIAAGTFWFVERMLAAAL